MWLAELRRVLNALLFLYGPEVWDEPEEMADVQVELERLEAEALRAEDDNAEEAVISK